jgi:hypothetical protein
MMIGSVGIGYWIAHGAFWLLLAFAASERGRRTLVVFLALWLAGYLALGMLSQGAALFVSYVALLDIGLVFAVFRGDVRLT